MLAKRLCVGLVLLGLASCGGGSSSSGGPSKPASAAEAKSAATGDIPDSQVFLTYRGPGYSIQYPEGWSQQGGGADTRFVNLENSIHVVVAAGPPPTAAAVAAALGRTSSPKVGAPKTIATAHAGPAILVSYSMPGPPDAVTGKRPVLTVDRYVYARGGRVATLDLASPVGVDNVDAYKMIGRGFRWR
jgi:hypothetical protein